MHELSIARDLFKIILQKAAEKNLGKITGVTIKVGEASGIDPDFLTHSLQDHVFPNTPARGAKIKINPEPAGAVCSDCGLKLTEKSFFKCDGCGSEDFSITGGKDVLVEDVEGGG